MSKDGEFVQWYKRDGQNLMQLKTMKSIDDIKVALEAAVHRQLMSDALWRIAFWRFRFFYHVRRCQKNMRKTY
jgi:hypothetical protein